MRSKRRILMGVVLFVALVGGVAGCGDDGASTEARDGPDVAALARGLAGEAVLGSPARGGTYRIENTEFAMSDAFDPSGEYFGSNWMIYSNLMLRTLVSYRFEAGAAGNELVPDLAVEIPDVSADGRTYTFTIKDGVDFGPPVNREVTSRDVRYALERIGTPSVAAQYAFYYAVIDGFEEFAEGKADTISGIATPDDKTISFTLTEPTGDFLYRLGLPATAPIPEEVARCHSQAGEYGRYVISTGPYMVEGADSLDVSSCASQKPISGFNPTSGLRLVRNPGYDPATDDTEIRESYPDRFEITVNTNLDNIFDRIERGELEGSFDSPTNAVLRRYLQDPDDRERLRVNPGAGLQFITMNLTTPPFDDVHVRKAMNLVMDLEGIQRAWGGPVQGNIATHVLPQTMLPIPEYYPYQQPPFEGDAEAARAEMAKSKYDTDKDGLCDAAACKGIVNLNPNVAPWSTMAPIVEQSAARIGLSVTTREVSRSTRESLGGTVARQVPFSSGTGWGKDFADPSTFAVLWDGREIIPVGNVNQSLVGLTRDHAATLGVPLPPEGVPSVDADIDRCQPLFGRERTDCWMAFDKKVMEEVVPEVPFIEETAVDLIGPDVARYQYDENSSEAALAHAALDSSAVP